MKYKKELVRRYILGEDVTPYDIDTLENDPEFMIMVIEETKDSKMYQFIGEEAKKSYKLVLKMIKLFPKEIELLKQIVNNYLQFTDDKVITAELLLMITGLMDEDDKDFMTYRLMLAGIVAKEDIECAVIKNALEKDPELKDEVGLGFFNIYDEFSGSTIVLDHFAKNMVIRLFKYSDTNIENILHRRFKKLSDLENYGTINFLVSYITSYDKSLGAYVAAHTHILKEYAHLVDLAKRNWEKYELDLESKRYYLMYYRLNEFHENMGAHASIYTLDEMIEFVGQELGIVDKLIAYNVILTLEDLMEYDYEALDRYDSKYDAIFVDDSPVIFKREKPDKSKFNFSDQALYQGVKKIMEEVLAMDMTDEGLDDYDEKKVMPMKNKIINFVPRRG